VKTGQVLNVDLSATGWVECWRSAWSLRKTRTGGRSRARLPAVDSTTQFHMVVFNEEPAVSGVSEGSLWPVTINPNAVFRWAAKRWAKTAGSASPG